MLKKITFLICILYGTLNAQDFKKIKGLIDQVKSFETLDKVISGVKGDTTVIKFPGEIIVQSTTDKGYQLYVVYTADRKKVKEYTISYLKDDKKYAEAYNEKDGWKAQVEESKGIGKGYDFVEAFEYNIGGQISYYENEEHSVQFKEYYSEGQVKMLYTYDKEKKEFRNNYFFSSGQLALVVEVKQNKFWKAVEAYNMKGEKIEKGNLSDGEGRLNYWDECGEVEEEIRMVKGKTTNKRIHVFSCNI